MKKIVLTGRVAEEDKAKLNSTLNKFGVTHTNDADEIENYLMLDMK